MGVFSLLKQQQKPLAVIWCFVFCFYSLAHATKNHKFDKISPCNFVNTNVSNPTWFYVATSAQTSKSFVLWTTKTPLKMLSQIDHKGFFLTVLWLNSKWLLTNRIWRRRGELVYISIHITYIYIFFFFEYVQIISCSNSKSNIAAAVRARAVKAFEIWF